MPVIEVVFEEHLIDTWYARQLFLLNDINIIVDHFEDQLKLMRTTNTIGSHLIHGIRNTNKHYLSFSNTHLLQETHRYNSYQPQSVNLIETH